MLRLSIIMKKYNNKYRIESVRLKNWDYRNNGAYFITINTGYRKHFFGEIINSEMQLSPIGEYAEKFWMEIPNHFPFVELGNFVVMPNHTHGILIINNVESLHCNDSTTNQYYSDISPKRVLYLQLFGLINLWFQNMLDY
jgi:REP element-mobilizing transposase RayT